MGNVPNPFDPQAVQAHLQAKQEHPPAVEPGTPVTQTESLGADVAASLDRWAAGGLDTFMEAMAQVTAVLQDMQNGLQQALDDGQDVEMDSLYLAAQLGKDLKATATDLYNTGRGGLWEATDHATRVNTTTPQGRSFKFLANNSLSRSVRYKELQEKYPEVYRDVVTETAVDPTKPGRLYL